MLRQRIATAVVLLALLAAALLWLPPGGLFLLFCLVTAAAAWEWSRIAGLAGSGVRALYAAAIAVAGVATWPLREQWPAAAAVLAAGVLWWLYCLWLLRGFPDSLAETRFGRGPRLSAGLPMLVPVPLALLLLMAHGDGLLLFGLLLLIVWGADIGAYFAGRAWGRHKLAPRVSPGKTREGALGGVVLALVLVLPPGLWLLPLDGAGRLLFMLLVALCIGASIIGDLVESAFKRAAGVKDSGALLPGHGGVLDRLDSLLTVAPLFALGMLLLLR